MGRYITPAQWNSMVRQAQQTRRQAIDKINREITAHDQKVKQAINQYNRAVDSYNARVRANRQRLNNELARLRRHTTVTRYVTFHVSVKAVQNAYERLEHAADDGRLEERYNEILDLSEREAANNAGLMNALMGDAEATELPSDTPESPLTPFLQTISAELAARWRGALYALSPRNPDAARHFCTSAREIIARILSTKAPDDVVSATMPDCDRTLQGIPTRRAKICYFLHLKGMKRDELEAFVESDMNNVVELFDVFNEGTHGARPVRSTSLSFKPSVSALKTESCFSHGWSIDASDSVDGRSA